MLAVELRAIKIFCKTFSDLGRGGGGGGWATSSLPISAPEFIKKTMAEQSQPMGHWKVLEQWKYLGLHTYGYICTYMYNMVYLVYNIV